MTRHLQSSASRPVVSQIQQYILRPEVSACARGKKDQTLDSCQTLRVVTMFQMSGIWALRFAHCFAEQRSQFHCRSSSDKDYPALGYEFTNLSMDVLLVMPAGAMYEGTRVVVLVYEGTGVEAMYEGSG